MSRDFDFNVTIPSLESINDPFIGFYPLESRSYVYNISLTQIEKPVLIDRIDKLNDVKTNIYNINSDKPVKISKHDYENRFGKKLSFDASSFFVTARNYINLSRESSNDLKPLLCYYGLLFLHSGISSIFFRVVSKAQTHGLSIIWPTNIPEDNQSLKDRCLNDFLDNIKVKISPTGAFSRIRDLYTILGKDSAFSSLIKDSNNSQLKDNQSSLLKNTDIIYSLKEINNFQYANHNFDRNLNDIASSEMLFDILSLFIMSSVARYRPTIWRMMMIGRGDMLPDILKVFNNLTSHIYAMFTILQDVDILDRD